MGHAVISVTMACVMALVGLQQVVGQKSNEDQVENKIPSVIMINQLAILEATEALKGILNITQDGQQQQCDAIDELISMRNSLERFEAQQATLFNSSINAWASLSDVPSTLQAIAHAADTYTPTACDETKEVTNRLDLLISTVNESSATTTRAIEALQNNTLVMMEVLQNSLQLQSDIYAHMKSESDKANDCCIGNQRLMENITQVVTALHEIKNCHEGLPCQMEDGKNGGLLKPCDKVDSNNRDKRHTSSSSCHLCCYESIGEAAGGIRLPVETESSLIVTPKFVTMTEPTCSNSEHTCSDGQCVSFYAHCDGQPDCLDGSDERDCPTPQPTCSNNEHTCSDGQCVSMYAPCDGHPDCLDGSDERDCLTPRVCCPASFMIVGSECFYISGRMADWFSSRRTCDDMGGYIAKPTDTDSLAQYIRNHYENKRWYWVEWSNLDAVPRHAEQSVSVIEHNCHVFDAGQENNQPDLQPSACSGTWYFICQHDLYDECESMKPIAV